MQSFILMCHCRSLKTSHPWRSTTYAPHLQRTVLFHYCYKQFIVVLNMTGLDNSMEGKVSTEFHHVVRIQMIWADSYYIAEDWVKHLIGRVLEMTHGQWLYQHAIVHKIMKDRLTRIEQEELLKRYQIEI